MSAEKLLHFLATTSSALNLQGQIGSYGYARILTVSSIERVLEIGVNETTYWLRASIAVPFLENASIWYAPDGSYYRAKVTESAEATWCDLAGTYVLFAREPSRLLQQLSPTAVDVLLEYADLRPKLGPAVPPLRVAHAVHSRIVESKPILTPATFTPEECARNARRLLDFAKRLEIVA